MTPLEEAGDNATEKEVLYTLHHDEGSGKDKEEEDKEEEEEENHDE